MVDALYVVTEALIAANRTRINTFALSERLPTIFNSRDFVQAGGLMSYGPDAVVRRLDPAQSGLKHEH